MHEGVDAEGAEELCAGTDVGLEVEGEVVGVLAQRGGAAAEGLVQVVHLGQQVRDGVAEYRGVAVDERNNVLLRRRSVVCKVM